MSEEMIEGRNPVVEALRAGRPLNKILLAQNIGQHSAIAEILHLTREQGIPVEHVTREALDRISRTRSHQGVIAHAAAREYATFEDLFAAAKVRNEPPLFCLLDGVEDPQNLGAVIRTAEAAGVHGVIIPQRRAAGLTAAVSRAAAGAVEYVPVVRVSNISQTLDALKKQSVWVVGLDMAGRSAYTEIDYKPPTVLVIGGEGRGLSDLVKKKCDFLARIPMHGKITSLNTSVAASLVMYEAMRQRGI